MQIVEERSFPDRVAHPNEVAVIGLAGRWKERSPHAERQAVADVTRHRGPFAYFVHHVPASRQANGTRGMDRGAADVLGQKVEDVGREWVKQMNGSRWIGGLAPSSSQSREEDPSHKTVGPR